ncbi:MAG TPA: outer membrane beta-barrel family protein [Chitinophaga sp.]|uniref:outer membrane beta-barrel family protein n=1 Tax=Chitinophaga sp. TaxID=1869181 RepID=UPI002C798856|nr:outer membrane beta-barrel family protein [Chitinophaga sp.]HVI48704.1 outer membrane beta-barrel family protein [Chitinophaga sp.]
MPYPVHQHYTILKHLLWILLCLLTYIPGVAQSKKDTTTVKNLKTVEILNRKKLFEKKPDRLIYNVQNSISAQTDNLWGQILKLPGVSSNAGNGLNYQNQSIRVLINDKPQTLSGEDLAEYLKSIPANNVSKIELITNPPSRYDAQGGVIINIVTQKKDKGIYGSIQSVYEQGTMSRFRNSADLNIQESKFGINMRYSLSNGTYLSYGNDETYYQKPGNVISAWKGNYDQPRNNSRHFYQVIFDYYLDKKSTLSAEFNGSNNRTTGNNVSNNLISHGDILDSIVSSTAHSRIPANNYSGNITYNLKIDSTGKQLLIYSDYTNYYKNSGQTVIGQTFDKAYNKRSPDNNFDINTTQNINLFSIAIDYTTPVFGKYKLETGVKYAFSQINNNLNYYTYTANSPTTDTTKSNQFIYTEHNAAAYTSISGTWKTTDFKAGIRVENTNTKGESVTNRETNKTQYLKIFPSVSLGTKIGAKHYVDFSYNRRISRPEYFRLNPFRYYGTPYQIFVGNPFLKPSLTDRWALGYTYDDNLYVTLYYTLINNSFQQLTYQDNVTSTLTYTHVNFGQKKEFGIYAGYSKSIAAWEVNLYFQLTRQIHQTMYLDKVLDNRNWRSTFSADNTFKISKKKNIDVQLSTWYVSGSVQGIFVAGSSFGTDIFLRKQFPPRWNASLGVTDLFLSQSAWYEVNYQGQHLRSIEWGDSRQVRLSLSYKFGRKGANVKNAVRKKSNEAEQQRI